MDRTFLHVLLLCCQLVIISFTCTTALFRQNLSPLNIIPLCTSIIFLRVLGAPFTVSSMITFLVLLLPMSLYFTLIPSFLIMVNCPFLIMLPHTTFFSILVVTFSVGTTLLWIKTMPICSTLCILSLVFLVLQVLLTFNRVIESIFPKVIFPFISTINFPFCTFLWIFTFKPLLIVS